MFVDGITAEISRRLLLKKLNVLIININLQANSKNIIAVGWKVYHPWMVWSCVGGNEAQLQCLLILLLHLYKHNKKLNVITYRFQDYSIFWVLAIHAVITWTIKTELKITFFLIFVIPKKISNCFIKFTVQIFLMFLVYVHDFTNLFKSAIVALSIPPFDTFESTV